jgi:hypothetical protein
MNIPFLRPRIPFELAEPGADPTRQPNPHPRKDFRDVLPWVFVGIALLAFGYLKFIRKPPPATEAKVQATATATPGATPNGTPGFFAVAGTPSGFFSTPQPSATPLVPTATPTPTAVVPTVTWTPTPRPGWEYGVFVDGEQIVCWCTATGDVGPVDVCREHVPTRCTSDG